MIEFGQEVCGCLDQALRREWLETNGIGGFASSTIIGLNTRRYHALLTAAIKPPLGRIVMLSKLEETLILNGERYELSANQYSGAIHPLGHQYLKGFRLDPFPIFTYEIANVIIEKAVFMVYGENTTVAQYELREKSKTVEDCRIEIRPLVAFRDYHSTTHENSALNSRVEFEKGLATVKPYADLPELYFAHDADELEVSGYWYRNFEYQLERERGLDFVEDLFNPFALKFDLKDVKTISVIASATAPKSGDGTNLRIDEIIRREKIARTAPCEDELVHAMNVAADQFIVARDDRKTVIAGYHWFSDWGRDAMIALPGLTLSRGRYDIARSILLEFARHIDRGMLPNRFPDTGERAEYNTIDATLWYFEAIRALVEQTGEYQFARESLYPTLLEIINWHERGARYRIHVDEDGLLYGGAPGAQLTWMDAKIGDWVVTPRAGKPVEIQALWYNALCIMQVLAHRFDDESNSERFGAMAARAKESFNRRFWNEETGCLYDVIDGEERDSSIRPNQILAVSLRHTMLGEEKARCVVQVVESELLTPMGLRSLATNDPRYIGRLEGDISSRDKAYHQGSVWAWLIGPFISAYLKVHGNDRAARAQAKVWLAGFSEHLRDAGLGQISEIFDGDAPHTPRGCIAQAWSVAEILRVAIETASDGSVVAFHQRESDYADAETNKYAQ